MKRNYGIDLLRMLLMYMVVVLHILGQGGVLHSVEIRTANYYISWMLEALCFCAVNCYALITGYVHYGRKYRMNSLLTILAQILFYSIAIYSLFWIFMPERISFGALLNAFLPTNRVTHWFVSSYAGLFLMIPLLNAAIQAFSREQAKYFFLVFVIAYTVIPTLAMGDPYTTYGGYSTLWLMCLYIVGAFIKKYNLNEMYSVKRSISIFSLCIIITLLSKFSLEEISIMISGESNYSEILLSYTSPTILFAGITLFLCFLNLQPGKWALRYLQKFSSAAFGVYLIHCHPYLYELMRDRFTFLTGWHPIAMSLGVICIAFGIYIPCLLIDYLRIKLFDKLHFKELIQKISNRIVPDYVSEM